jgi:signal peptidase II
VKAPKVFLVVLLTLGTVGCDQLTKQVAMRKLDGLPPQSYLGDTLRLEYSENRGAFLGLGAEWPDAARIGLLVVASALALAGVSIAAVRLRWTGSPLLGALLVVGSGASNLIDRIVRGSVVDFMNVGVGSIRTGIFNWADFALLLGLALIAFGSASRWRPPSAGRDDA